MTAKSILRALLAASLLFSLQACSADESVVPGARPAELQRKLDAALAAKGPAYRPRTEHLRRDGQPVYTNRLILEDSPYLLQHAHNPVDWFAWGEEAFAKARRENKPVFLSIGYSTCHWCHVMEKESFENPAIARQLNAHFVAIKVDRETRPDLDHLYMSAVQLMTGHGGWPMTTLLTPQGKVFFGGTYFRPEALGKLLGQIEHAWQTQRPAIEADAARITQAVEKSMTVEAAAAALPPDLAARTAHQLLQGHDALQGGFGAAPKFPNEPLLAFWLEQARRGTDKAILDALRTDLDAMAAGGIHDQTGGGFHRYATDNDWLVPHFEKMLYNQAQLARLYADAFQLTGKADYARVARRTLDFVLREMTAPQGGFYAALDADSGGGEGRYYLWTLAEIRKALNPADAAFAIRQYGLTEAGNFEGSNILYLSRPVTGAARSRLDRIDAALLKARSTRAYPHRDDKVLTGWNGLMIIALAEAAVALDEPRYLDVAKRAADFLWTKHRRPDGGLWRASLAGRAGTPGMLEDYAYLAEGLIALYDATRDHVWLTRAQSLADAMQARFGNKEGAVYALAETDPLSPLPRPRDTADGALPSANGVAVHVLAALARRSGETRYEDMAQAQLAALAGTLAKDPTGHATLLAAADRLRLGETGPRQYAGRGAVRAEARLGPDGKLDLTLRLQPGWHVNAHQPLQDYLIPTTLTLAGSGWTLTEIAYPQAEVLKLGFQREALALYQGEVHLRARLRRSSGEPTLALLQLRLQACSERICLAPETLGMRLPVQPGT